MRPALLAALAALSPIACVAPDAAPPDAGADAARPVYSTCPEEPRATVESLSAKAAAYDARAIALHVSPAMPWVLDVQLKPGIDPLNATAADVAVWRASENDGLWSGLYLASQAYRFAVTRDPAALANLRRLLDGERTRMRVTGVSGLFTRELIPPGVPGIACPADPALYVPSTDKRANRWVRIGADGCAQVADAQTLAFASTAHCGLDAWAGWCFLDNVSQDEYVGHLFALGAIAHLVDDPGVRASAAALAGEVGAHLVANGMELVDWDGRPTQWGKIHPGAAGDAPGYLAVMGIAFLAIAADATGDAALWAAHDQKFAEWQGMIDDLELWSGADGCGSNWNDVSMMVASLHHAVWLEPDPARRAQLASVWDRDVMRAPLPRAAAVEKNAWFDIAWAGEKPLDAAAGGPAYDQVHDALCQLRQFPASNHSVAHDSASLAPEACLGRLGDSMADAPFDVADRCAATYAWWGNPYDRQQCAADPTMVQQPAGYLLPYWMGRYYGFVPAD